MKLPVLLKISCSSMLMRGNVLWPKINHGGLDSMDIQLQIVKTTSETTGIHLDPAQNQGLHIVISVTQLFLQCAEKATSRD